MPASQEAFEECACERITENVSPFGLCLSRLVDWLCAHVMELSLLSSHRNVENEGSSKRYRCGGEDGQAFVASNCGMETLWGREACFDAATRKDVEEKRLGKRRGKLFGIHSSMREDFSAAELATS